MLPDDAERVAVRHVPGAGRPEICRLGAGLVNETYRVLRDGSAYAMRLTVSNRAGLGLDSAWEVRVLETAVAAGLAPAPEYCDPQRGILISRWVDGRPWSPAEVRRPENVAKMAGFMRRIHALPIPAPARSMSPAKWIDHYSAAAAPRAGAGPGAAAAPLRDAAAARLAALAALPDVDPALCHSDLHALNLIDRGGSLVLLDWEYAHASDPLWDVAGWGANNDFEDGLKADLLASYAGRPPTENERLRLRLLSWLYDYVCLWWSEVYLSTRRGFRPGIAVQDDALGGISGRALQLAGRLNASK